MAIPVTCVCGRRVRVKDEHAGRMVRCPACGLTIRVPESGAEGAAPTPPASPDPVVVPRYLEPPVIERKSPRISYRVVFLVGVTALVGVCVGAGLVGLLAHRPASSPVVPTAPVASVPVASVPAAPVASVPVASVPAAPVASAPVASAPVNVSPAKRAPRLPDVPLTPAQALGECEYGEVLGTDHRDIRALADLLARVKIRFKQDEATIATMTIDCTNELRQHGHRASVVEILEVFAFFVSKKRTVGRDYDYALDIKTYRDCREIPESHTAVAMTFADIAWIAKQMVAPPSRDDDR